MKKPIVKGWRGASFRGVDFARNITSWEDTREPGGPVHRYNKRDGGEAEPMGRLPHQTIFRLSFIGPTWRDEFIKLQAAIDENPLGTLVHPIYGSVTMFCRGYSGARMDLENSPNLYDVPLKFVESQIDTKVTASAAQGPAAKGQQATTVGSNLSTAAASFTTAAAAISALVSAASTYTAAAVSAAANLTPDSSLASQLATVESLTDAAIVAVNADPIAAPGVSTPTLVLIEQLYDACAQVDDAVRAQRPAMFEFTLPMRMHITSLARVFYGPDGAARESEILTNNADRIIDPGFMPAGTKLWMSPPTV